MGDDFEVVGRIIVDASGAGSIETMNSSLETMKGKSSALGGATQALGQMWNYVWGNIIFSAISKATQAIGQFFSDIVTKGEEAQATQAQLQAVIKSTGDASGVTAEMANKMADSFANSTRFTKDQTLSAENMLLTFTSIGKDVFPNALTAVTNIATAMKEDLKGASIQVGKALQDPVTGMAALHRVGVQFTEQQKEQVKTFIKANDLASAQGVILKELSKEFGGSAEAAGKTFGGQMDILNHKLDEAKVKLFNVLSQSPLIQKAFDVAGKATEVFNGGIDELSGSLQNFPTDPVGLIADLLYKLGYYLESIGFKGANDFFSNLGDGFIATTKYVKELIDKGLALLQRWWERNGPGISAAAQYMLGGIQKLLANLGPQFSKFISDTLQKFQQWFIENGPLITKTIQTIAVIFTDVLIPAIEVAWSTIEPILSGIIELFMDILTFIMQVFTGDWKGAWQSIEKIAITVWNALKQALFNFLDGIAKAMGTSLQQIANDWRNGWEGLVETVREAINSAIKAVEAKLNEWYQLGSQIINGIISGIMDNAYAVEQTLSDIVNSAVTAVQSALGIQSPSKVFANIGKQMMQGWAMGIGGGVDLPVKAILTGSQMVMGSAVGGSGLQNNINTTTSSYKNSNHFGNVNNIYVSSKSNPIDLLKNLRSV